MDVSSQGLASAGCASITGRGSAEMDVSGSFFGGLGIEVWKWEEKIQEAFSFQV